MIGVRSSLGSSKAVKIEPSIDIGVTVVALM